jgi:two-component system uhpT operon response regulator UhpA
VDEPTNGVVRRVLIVEDHPVTQEGLQALFASADHLECCGTATSVAEARHLLNVLEPDVIVLDLSLGDEDGEELLDDLDESRHQVVVYSMFDLDHRGRHDLVGKVPFVSKLQQPSELVEAIYGIRQFESGAAAPAPAPAEV